MRVAWAVNSVASMAKEQAKIRRRRRMVNERLVFMGDIKFSALSFEQRRGAALRAGGKSWKKYFLCSNQAGSSPHTKWMKFSANYSSRRDSFSLCQKTRNPHWLWLAARVEFQIFSGRQAFRFGLILQKHPEQSRNGQLVNRKSIPLCKL